MYGNYMNNYGNQRGYYPYFPNNMSETQNRIMPIQQTSTGYGLLGKPVESIDVVKVLDIPLDNSISYFPLTDGSAIVTKQLQIDGTSKMIVYKPVNEEKKQQQYLTINEFEEKLAGIDFEELNDLKDFKNEIKNLRKEFDKLKNSLKGDKK